MEPIRGVSNASRPPWEMDRLLARMMGRPIRVGAGWFSLVRWHCRFLPEFVRVADLILPDKSRPGPLRVFFEGRLRQIDRHFDQTCQAIRVCRLRGSRVYLTPPILRLFRKHDRFPVSYEQEHAQRVVPQNAKPWAQLRERKR